MQKYPTQPNIPLAHDSITQLRTRFVQIILIFLVVANVLLAFLNSEAFVETNALLFLLTGTLAAFFLFLSYRGLYVDLIRNLTPVLLAVGTFSTSPEGNITLITMMIFALMSAAILTRREYFGVVAGIIGVRALIHIVGVVTTFEGFEPFIGALLLSAIPFLLGFALRYFANELEKAVDRSQRTTDLLGASAIVGQALSEVLDQDELLPRAAGLLRDRFGFYQVHIFLMRTNNDTEQPSAVLVASTSENGQQLIAQGHQDGLQLNSMIGQAFRANEPLLIGDTQATRQYSNDKLLGNTRSQLIVPLLDGQERIGALVVQSTRPHAFTSIDIQALQVMASQLAIAIRNARLFEAQSSSGDENKRLIERLREALRQVERLNERLTGRVWSEYLENTSQQQGITVDFAEDAVDFQASWTETLAQAADNNHLVQQEHDDKQIIALPLQIRGQVVGAMEFELDDDGQFSPESLDLIQEVGVHFAQAAENVRLLEQAQNSAQREFFVNDVSSRLQATGSVEATLAEAARGLQKALNAERVAIRLGKPNMELDRKNGA